LWQKFYIHDWIALCAASQLKFISLCTIFFVDETLVHCWLMG
jgi:hypothetical protein